VNDPKQHPVKSLRLTATGVDVVRESKVVDEAPPRDAATILRENQEIEARYAKPIDFVPTSSRRKRDYWIVLTVGNALIVGLVAMLPKNPAVLIYGLSALVIFSVGITWIMWAIVDDY
jgi:hypothetical protein